MPDNTKELFNKLHTSIMLHAEEWAQDNNSFRQGALLGTITAWFVVAAHFQIENFVEIYREYQALVFAPAVKR